jgi:Fe2+ or Zn2+ uptake regulation protein
MRKQSGHEHLLICTSCGKAVTFHGDNFDDLSHEVAADTGFSIQDHMLQLFGLCPDCQEKG